MKKVATLVIQPYLASEEEGQVTPFTNLQGQAVVFQLTPEEFEGWDPQKAVDQAIQNLLEAEKPTRKKS